MLERPGAADLLAAARAALLGELLPHLPEAQRYAARMIANAMAIAAREAEADPAAIAALAERLRALAGGAPDPLRALAAAIRAGAFDPGAPRRGEAAVLLLDLARARCAVSAPRALAGG